MSVDNRAFVTRGGLPGGLALAMSTDSRLGCSGARTKKKGTVS